MTNELVVDTTTTTSSMVKEEEDRNEDVPMRASDLMTSDLLDSDNIENEILKVARYEIKTLSSSTSRLQDSS